MRNESMNRRTASARRRFLARTGVAVLAAVGLSGARAQEWPARPIKLIVPFPPGGALDGYVRAVQPVLAQSLGQPVVVENTSGAGGLIGAQAVARAAPDGYTVLAGNVQTLSMNAAVYAKMPYDPQADFEPVVQTVMVNYVMVVHPSVPARTLPELLAWARAQPGRLTFASSGVGSAQHLAGALLQARTGLQFTHVPYKGIGAVVGDILAGHVNMVISDQASMMPHVKAGKLRALAVGSANRSSDYPDLPTIAEAANLPDFEAVAWQGFAVPRGTPAAVIDKLNSTMNRLQTAPATAERLRSMGFTLVGGSAEAFRRYIAADLAKWVKVARDNNIRAEQ